MAERRKSGEKKGGTVDIYDKSCIPCHRVHMPAAFMQMYLKQERIGER